MFSKREQRGHGKGKRQEKRGGWAQRKGMNWVGHEVQGVLAQEIIKYQNNIYTTKLSTAIFFKKNIGTKILNFPYKRQNGTVINMRSEGEIMMLGGGRTAWVMLHIVHSPSSLHCNCFKCCHQHSIESQSVRSNHFILQFISETPGELLYLPSSPLELKLLISSGNSYLKKVVS